MRFLTPDEITWMTNDFTTVRMVHQTIAENTLCNIRKMIEKDLKTIELSPEHFDAFKKELTRRYFECQIQPGESVGVLAAQSIGERQTQLTLNSIDSTEKVLYIKDNVTIVEPIGTMIDRLLSETPEKIERINDIEYLALPDGYMIPSLDLHGYTSWRKIEGVSKHLPGGKVVKVTTYSGRTVIASKGESFLVWNDTEFEVRKGSDIKIGDVLPTTYRLKAPETQTHLSLEKIFPKTKYTYSDEIHKAIACKNSGEIQWFYNNNGNVFVTPYKRGDTMFAIRWDKFQSLPRGCLYLHPAGKWVSNFPVNIPLDYDFGFLIGIYLAEGWCTLTFVGISNKDELVRQRVIEWCERYGITHHLAHKVANNLRNGTGVDLKLHSVLLARLLKILCDTGSLNKRIPDFAYTAPKIFLRGLIDGYISGDGCVGKDGNISASSISLPLIKGFAFLLTYFNIFSKIYGRQQKKNNVGSLNIHYAYILNICNGMAQEFARQFTLTEAKKQERLETITLQKNYKYKIDGINRNYPEKDVYFDKITKIEEIDATNGYVYDFEVEGTRNFTVWSGLNLIDSFHSTGTSIATVTTGVPRFSELTNASKNPKQVITYVHFTHPPKNYKQAKDILSYKCIKFRDIIDSKRTGVYTPRIWESHWINHYNANTPTKEDTITTYTLNLEKIYKYRLSLTHLTDSFSIENIMISPLSVGTIDVWGEIDFKALEETVLKGLPGVTEEYIQEETSSEGKKNYILYAIGSHMFHTLLLQPGVCTRTTISDNMWEIYEILGIEAARDFLSTEITKVISTDSSVNSCHINLIVDTMTCTGRLTSINRYGVQKDRVGALSKLSFETPLAQAFKAGCYGEYEANQSVSSCIATGKVSTIGTGLCTLMYDTEFKSKCME